jgi:hypothetical protein
VDGSAAWFTGVEESVAGEGVWAGAGGLDEGVVGVAGRFDGVV